MAKINKKFAFTGLMGALLIMTLILIPPSLAIWTGDLNDRIMMYYTFNETTGTTAYDSLGRYNLSVTGNLWKQIGIINSSYQPNGDTSISTLNLTGFQNLTFSFWIRRNGTMPNSNLITYDNCNFNGELGISLSGLGSNILSVCVRNGTGFQPNFTMNQDQWYYVAFTTNATNFAFYVNGTLNASYPLTGFMTANNNQYSNNLTFFSFSDGVNRMTNTYIDEFALWNKTLTPEQISALYNNGLGITYNPDAVTIGLNSPPNLQVLLAGKPSTFNCSYVGTATLSNITLNINGVMNYTQAGTAPELIKSLSFDSGSYNWSCQARDTSNNLYNSSTYFFYVSELVENSQNYSTPVYETSIEQFQINITYNSSLWNNIQAELVYNGTSYPATGGSGDNVIFSRSIAIPVINLTTDTKNLFWNISLTNATGTYYINSTRKTQIVRKGSSLVSGTSCPAGFNPAINFSFYWEPNITAINGSANYFFTYGLGGNLSGVVLNGSVTNVPNFYLCINNSQDYYYVGYGEIQYSSVGAVSRRSYIFTGTRITNVTLDLPLLALDSGSATSFLVTAQSTSLIPYNNHYIGLLRWYPNLNSYKTADMGKTDDNGDTVLRVKTEDVDYRLALYNQTGSLIKMLDPIRLICQTNPCTYTIYIDTSDTDLSTFVNIQKSLSYNNETHRFTFVWNDPSQTSQTINLSVYKDSGTSSAIICSTTSSGYTGVLVCDVTGYGGVLRAEAYRTASPTTIIDTLVEILSGNTGFLSKAGAKPLGLFLGFLIVVIVGLVGIFNPVLAVVMTIIALVPLMFLGSINFMILSGIAVVGGIIIHFIGRAR